MEQEIKKTEEYNIGDKVWWATCETSQITIPCPVCFGKKVVVLILGNEEKVQTECEYCRNGLSDSRGYTEEWQRISGVKLIELTGKEVAENTSGRTVEYRYQNYCLKKGESIFDTEDEAKNRVVEMIKEYEDSEVSRNAHKKRSSQSHTSWSVGYHRGRLKNAEREVVYHSSKVKTLLNK